ncbi:MAG: ctaB [Candidatus Saccharibacteria bacterium]|nr:ctaB [Candidatus Saccharibacteria bacterium]
MDYKASLRRYYVLSKPGIVYANVLTAAAGYLYASVFDIDFTVLVGLVAGMALLIAGACAYNNYLDRGIDAVMARTLKRGLVTGDIASWKALLYATITASGGLALLTLTQNGLTTWLAVIAFVDYVILYGIGKRKTVHGTLVGCIAGSIPLVAGYTAVVGRIDAQAWLLFFLMVAWQMAHFYSIALYRVKDYKAAKIPVMPAVYGATATKLQAVLYMALFIALAICLIIFGDIGWLAGGLLVILGGIWLAKALRSYRVLQPAAWGRQSFLFSLIVVLTMSFSLAVGPLLGV